MNLKTVRPRQGLLWVRAGFRVFFLQPLSYTMLFSLLGVGGFLLLQLPLLGPVLLMSLMPTATVAFLLATRDVLAGRAPRAGLLVVPLKDRAQRGRLLQLGAIYALGAVVVVLLAHVLDGGRFAAAVEALGNDPAAAEAALQDTDLPYALLLRLAMMGTLSLMFWHAPGLVCWGGMPVGKALFASTLACWRSLGAFMLYGLTWFVLLLLGVTLTQMVFSLLGLQQAIGQALLPLTLLFSTVFYASLYFTFVDSFEIDATGDPTPH